MNLLWVALVILALLLLAVGFLTRYWHVQSEKTARMTFNQLRYFSAENRSMRQKVSREYKTSDPEPFGSRVAQLIEKLDESEQLTRQLGENYSQLRQEMTAASFKRLLNLPLAPYNWRRIHQQAQLLKQKERSISTADRNVRLYFQNLSSLGWEVADKARQTQRRVMEVGSHIDHLSVRQVKGEAIESAVRKQTALLNAMENIPEYLVHAEESEVVARADKHTIVQAYQVITEKESLLNRLQPRVEKWVEQHTRAVQDVEKLNSLVQEIKGSLADSPVELNLSHLKMRLLRLEEILTQLTARLETPLADNLSSLAKETNQLRRVAEDLQKQFTEALRQLGDYRRVIGEISSGQRILIEQVSSLEKSPFYPIIWDVSRPELEAIKSDVDLISLDRISKTPIQIENELSKSDSLRERLVKLADTCQIVEDQYAEFMVLLEKIDMTELMAWRHEARQVHDKVRRYDPKNWPYPAEMAFGEELDLLESRLKNWAPTSPTTPVRQSELPERLHEIRQITDLNALLEGRVEAAQKRLEDLEGRASEAEHLLDEGRDALNQVGLAAAQNSALQKIISPHLGPLQNEIEDLTEKLKNTRQGLVEKKIDHCAALIKRIESQSADWQAAFNQEIAASTTRLQKMIAGLDAIAPLEDAEVRMGRAALESIPANQPPLKEGLPLDRIAPAFQEVNETWQLVADAVERLKEIWQPVQKIYREAGEQRQQALEQVEEAGKWSVLQPTRSPNLPTIGLLKQELQQLEKDWQALSKTPCRSAQLVSQLAGFFKNYQGLAENAGQLIQHAEAEHDRVLKVEDEVNELIELWDKQLGRYAGNPLASSEIQDLIDQATRALNAVEKQYTKEQITSRQFLQELRSLRAQLNDAAVPVGDDRFIDVNGLPVDAA